MPFHERFYEFWSEHKLAACVTQAANFLVDL